MSTFVIRPTSLTSRIGSTTPSTAATVVSYLSDNSDTTFVTHNEANGPLRCAFNLAAPTIPANEFAARLGWSIRYKGDVNGLYTIGANVIRPNEDPSGYPAIRPNSSAAFTTTQLAYKVTNWPNTDFSSLQYYWYSNRYTGTNAVEHAELFATVYTLQKATATPQGKTETQSVFPTIAVDTAVVLGWESSTFDWQNLRKVTVELRVKQGGVSADDGTLISQTTATFNATATGTTTLQIQVPDALQNGTYKVYARALRYRESTEISSDQYGAWSSAATLTMNTPVPAAPTVTATADQAIDRVTINVTPVATTGYLNPFIYLQRSDDGGVSWVPVRNAFSIAGSFGAPTTFYDFEAPRGQSVEYRAYVEASKSGFINQGLYSTHQAVVLTVDKWNLKAPLNLGIDAIGINVIGKPEESMQEDMGIFRPLNRKYPVVVSGTISSWDGTLTVQTRSNLEWQTLKAIVESQKVLYLESAFGWSKYVRLTNGAKAALAGTSSFPIRTVNLQYVEVSKPPVLIGQTVLEVEIPALIDGGDANDTYDGFYDGGFANSVPVATFDGGDA